MAHPYTNQCVAIYGPSLHQSMCQYIWSILTPINVLIYMAHPYTNQCVDIIYMAHPYTNQCVAMDGTFLHQSMCRYTWPILTPINVSLWMAHPYTGQSVSIWMTHSSTNQCVDMYGSSAGSSPMLTLSNY